MSLHTSWPARPRSQPAQAPCQMLTRPLSFLLVHLLLRVSFPSHLHGPPSASSMEPSLVPWLAGIVPSPKEVLSWPLSALLLQGTSIHDLSLSSWFLRMALAHLSTPPTPAPQHVCVNMLLPLLHPPGCPLHARPHDARSPWGSARALPPPDCWTRDSVNQQTLPRAYNGLSTFLSTLGRVWGGSLRSPACSVGGNLVGRPEAPGITPMVPPPPPGAHSPHPCNHCTSLLLFLENASPPMAGPPGLLTPQSSPGPRLLQPLLGPPRFS